jgi:hypothetical protein
MEFEFLWRQKTKKIQTRSKIICTVPIIQLYLHMYKSTYLRRWTPYWRSRARNIPTIYLIVGIAPAGPVFLYFYNSIFAVFYLTPPFLYVTVSIRYIYIYAYATTNAGMIHAEKNVISHARTNFVLNAPTIYSVRCGKLVPVVCKFCTMVIVLYVALSLQIDSTVVIACNCNVFRHHLINNY